MSDIFISYSSQDRETVVSLVDYLEQAGFSIWWDRHIRPGQAYDRDIEAKLDAAKCVVVVWSRHSVESDWVRAEANEGLMRRILVPVSIDDSQPPLVFRRLQTMTLKAADGSDLAQLAAAVETHVPREQAPAADERITEIERRPARAAAANEGIGNWHIPPFVGREHVLGVLNNALAAVENRHGQVVLLAGEPGIGKSRTAQEFTRQVLARNASVYSGWCDESMSTPPYWPWIRLVRSMLEQLDPLIRKEDLGSSGPVLASLIPEIRQIWPDLDDMPEYSPERLSFELAQAICTLIKRCAERQTMLIVLDDLHRADEQTLQVLNTLAREIARSPVIILGTFRDVEVEVDHLLTGSLVDLSRLTHYRRLELRGLSRDEIERFLLQTTENPAELLDAIVEKTEGNPLFVTEISRTVNSSSPEGGDINLQELIVPQSLKELVLGRLHSLSPDCRQFLDAAAVMGRELESKMLEAVGGFSPETIDRAIAEANRAGIVGAGPNSTSRFSHILIRDALYEEIPRGRRQELHLAIADTLVATSKSERAFASHAESIAHHYQEAGLNEKAMGYWEQAASIAVGQSAHAEAIIRLERALSLLPDIEQPVEVRDAREIQLRLTLGNAHTIAEGGGSMKAVPEFKRAHELCNRYPDSTSLFRAVSGLWGYHAMRCDKEAFPLVERQLELAQQHNSSSYFMLASNAAAMTQFFEGDFGKSIAHLEIATRCFDEALERRMGSSNRGPWRSPAVSSPMFFAWNLALVGRAKEAEGLADKTLSQAVNMGTHAHVQALSYLAAVFETVRDFERLRAVSEKIIGIAKESGYASWLAVAHCTHGWALACLGDPLAGLEEAQKGCDDYEALGSLLCVSCRKFYLADILRMAARIPDAIHLIEQTLESGKDRFEHFYDAELIRLRGECALDQGDEVQGLSYVQQALSLAKGRGAKLFELRAATTLLQHAPEEDAISDLRNLNEDLKNGIGELDFKRAMKVLSVAES